MQAPSKEEILKKIEDPNTVTEVVNKFFGELDKANTGFITKEDYLKKSEEFAKEKFAGLPHHEPTPEQKAKFLKFVDENTLSVNIRRLRKKIEQDPKNPIYIITVFGIGYIFGE